MVTTVRKEEGEIIDRDLLKNKSVQHVLNVINASEEQLAAFETAMIDLALYDLHLFKDDIREGIKKYEEAHIKKFYRAYAKANLDRISKGLTPISKERAFQSWMVQKNIESGRGRRAGMQYIETYDREDGTPVRSHWRQLRRGEQQTEATREKIDEERQEIAQERAQSAARRRQVEMGPSVGAEMRQQEGGMQMMGDVNFDIDPIGFGIVRDQNLAKAKYALDSVWSAAEESVNDQSHFRQAANRFFREDDYTQGAVGVADYFSGKGKLGTVAKIARDYGPMAAMRMVNAYYRYGGYDVPVLEDRQGNRKTEFGDKIKDGESPAQTRQWAVDTLKKRLPGQDAEDANAEPPSEGFILNVHGEVIAHGVGRGNDHYLPFSNKHMRKIRKGEGTEWVRRRMYGGPTVEDLYSAMSSGADRFTVVSNAGEFTMEVSPRAHGLGLDTIAISARFQDILNKGSANRTFVGYSDALHALQSEYPLLFRMKKEPKRGDWSEGDWASREDHIGPKTSLFEEFRDLFRSSKDEERRKRAERERSISAGGSGVSRRGEAARAGMPGANSTESIYAAYERKRELREGKAAIQAEAAYKRLGRSVPQDVRLAAQKERGGSGTPPVHVRQADPEQRAASVRPPQEFLDQMEAREQSASVPGAMSSDDNITVGPTVPTSRQAQSTPDPARSVFNEWDDAVERADRLGFDMDGPVRNPDQALEVMQNLYFFDDEEWENLPAGDFTILDFNERLKQHFRRKSR